MKEQRFRVNPQILLESTGQGCVLIHKVTGDCYELNELGATVWNRLHTGESVVAMADALSLKYGVSKSKLESDFESLLGDLVKHGLVIEG